ncbi:MAG: flagellar basal body-associated FliL family protein [Burkholderiales bacterium]|nr:flagellar basal body-associated FliL family protein [Burkholderiales bacterium]
MSAATAEVTDATTTTAKPAGKKKLLILIVATVLLLVIAGGGAAFFMSKKKAAAEEGEDADEAPVAAQAHDKKDDKHAAAPVFLPLDPFTVNLADRDAERYAQIAVTLEIDEAKTGDAIKAYLPAIRNNILMLLSHKTAGELLTYDGKLALAKEIRRESLRPLGYTVDEGNASDAHGADSAKKGKKVKKKAEVIYPIKAVHFANIIIQ